MPLPNPFRGNDGPKPKRKPPRIKSPAELRANNDRLKLKQRQKMLDYVEKNFPQAYARLALKEAGLLDEEQGDSFDKQMKVYERIDNFVHRRAGKDDKSGGVAGAIQGIADTEMGKAFGVGMAAILGPVAQQALGHKATTPAAEQPPPPQPVAQIPQTVEETPAMAERAEKIKQEVATAISNLQGKTPQQAAQLMKMAATVDGRSRQIVDDLMKLPPTPEGLALYLKGQMDASPEYNGLWNWLAQDAQFLWCVEIIKELQGHKLPANPPAPKRKAEAI